MILAHARWRLATWSAVAIAAALVAACGGSGGGASTSAGAGTTTAASANQPSGSGPTIARTVRVAKRNQGLKTCKKVSYGTLDNTPDTPTDPRLILSITCDDLTVGVWERYKTAEDRARGDRLEHRPYLVNGPIRVGTGEALLAHIDANAWASMPAELKAACTCGQLRQPTK